MDEATLERHLHLTMTLIGGFMGGYAILNRHDVQWMPWDIRMNSGFSVYWHW